MGGNSVGGAVDVIEKFLCFCMMHHIDFEMKSLRLFRVRECFPIGLRDVPPVTCHIKVVRALEKGRKLTNIHICVWNIRHTVSSHCKSCRRIRAWATGKTQCSYSEGLFGRNSVPKPNITQFSPFSKSGACRWSK